MLSKLLGLLVATILSAALGFHLCKWMSLFLDLTDDWQIMQLFFL